MITPKDLNEEQTFKIRQWADEGLDLNLMQKKINEELGLSATFMETRLLLLDLGIELASNKPAPAEANEEKPGDHEQTAELPAPTGATVVTLDEITPAHAIIAGKVTFISGKRATWYFDKTGRIDWTPLDGEPSEEDLRGFETELQKVLRKQMGGI